VPHIQTKIISHYKDGKTKLFPQTTSPSNLISESKRELGKLQRNMPDRH